MAATTFRTAISICSRSKRFHDEIRRPFFHRLYRRVDRPIRGNHDDRGLRGEPFHPPQDIHPACFGHSHIGDHRGKSARLELVKGLCSAFRGLDFIPATGKAFRQHRSHGWFVIDKQNLYFLHHASRARKRIRFPCCRTAEHRFSDTSAYGNVFIVTPTILCSVHSKEHPLSRHRSSSRQMHHQQSPQPLHRQTSSRPVRDC